MSDMEVDDERVVCVGGRLNEQAVKLVRQKAKHIFSYREKPEFHFSSLCHQLFEVDLFFIHPKITDKDELITMMVKKMEEKGVLRLITFPVCLTGNGLQQPVSDGVLQFPMEIWQRLMSHGSR